MKVLALRRTGACIACGIELLAGTEAEWDSTARTVRCRTCSAAANAVGTDAEAVAPISGGASARTSAAGGSAQREYERRHTSREERVRARHPKIGGLLLALVDDPTTTKVWAQGAEGERAVAERLDRLPDAIVLHDRRMRRPDGRVSQANIDHIAVTPTGVWVIDAKTHKGRLEVRRSGGLFTPPVEQLRINGRDQTGLVDGIIRQVEAVTAALAHLQPAVPVHGALCFVGTELPWIDEDIAGIPLRGRRGLLKLLGKPGPLDDASRQNVSDHLRNYFPSAPL